MDIREVVGSGGASMSGGTNNTVEVNNTIGANNTMEVNNTVGANNTRERNKNVKTNNILEANNTNVPIMGCYSY